LGAEPHPWRRVTARRFFWLTGLRRVFRRGTNGSNPSPSSGESRANRANPDTAAATGALGLKNVKHIQGFAGSAVGTCHFNASPMEESNQHGNRRSSL